MRFNRHIDHGPQWNDPDTMPEPRAREIEEQVELRVRAKKLADLPLPQCFRLVTPTPKQFWIGNQLVWAFCLGWAPLDRQGERQSSDLYRSVFRYDWHMSDEVQMSWAVEDFARELEAAGSNHSVDISRYRRAA